MVFKRNAQAYTISGIRCRQSSELKQPIGMSASRTNDYKNRIFLTHIVCSKEYKSICHSNFMIIIIPDHIAYTTNISNIVYTQSLDE